MEFYRYFVLLTSKQIEEVDTLEKLIDATSLY